MDDYAVPPEFRAPREMVALREMAERIRAGSPPTVVEIEHDLEVGVCHLMGLETELARARRRAAGGEDPTSMVDDLQRRITALRDALVDLRMVSCAPSPPWIGYGFVLPDRHAAPSQPRSGRSAPY
jgi:hypothetical protein